ncbi:MAG TPA: hypothetical protein VG225_13650 [Terracidiphilus sp.]|jgi:hypothetical protein|nr:hypothetical protein [Terracidiphilus sp.]
MSAIAINLTRRCAPTLGCILLLAFALANAQQLDQAALVRRIDAANQARYDRVMGFTDTEHYAVFRRKDESHPAAEMTVHMTYRKGAGKTYKILAQSGSPAILRFGLRPLLENEKAINDPAKVADSWFTSADYDMQVRPEAVRMLKGRTCVGIVIKPRRKAPNMIDGMLWVYPVDGAIMEVEGIASKSPSVFARTTKMMRLYAIMDGYAMAIHARAESHNAIFGRTVVTIDYSDYHLELRPQQ